MSQKDQSNPLLPEWLTEQTAGIKQLSQSETDLKELIDDHARLIDAIIYWEGKSEEKVEEFRYLAKELKSEINAMLSQEWY